MKILFPLNNSVRNEGAFAFLADITAKVKTEIHVLHSYLKPVPVSDIPKDYWEKESAEAEINAKETLLAFVNILKNSCPEAEVSGDIRAGEKEDVIKKTVKERKTDLLLIVRKASHGLSSELFSTLSDILEKAECPVFIFPENHQYKGLHKMLFATQFSDEDIEAVNFLAGLAAPLKSKITIVNVYDQPEVVERLVSGEFERMIREKTDYPHIDFLNKKGESPEVVLDEMIPETNASFISMSSRHRNILGKLYSPGLTWKMISEGQLPVLAFHRN